MTIWERIKDWFEKTFGPEGLFSSGQEGHAFLIGICEIVAFPKPRYEMPEDYEAWLFRCKGKWKPGNPLYEYHYYQFGRLCGILFWLVAIPLEIFIIVRIF